MGSPSNHMCLRMAIVIKLYSCLYTVWKIDQGGAHEEERCVSGWQIEVALFSVVVDDEEEKKIPHFHWKGQLGFS